MREVPIQEEEFSEFIHRDGASKGCLQVDGHRIRYVP